MVKNINSVKHDRYLIYRMLGRHVGVRPNSNKCRQRPVAGLVTDVARDIFSKNIELTIGKSVFKYREPNLIFNELDEIVFVYGIALPEISDVELFEKMNSGSDFGMSADEILNENKHDVIKTIRFSLGTRIKRHKIWQKQK